MKTRPGVGFAAAFTLIELLIVVAIISILAGILLFNMGEATMRSKLARVKADMRTLVMSIEEYRADRNKYPPDNFPGQIHDEESFYVLTTPLAYLTTIPDSPFKEPLSPPDQNHKTYQYWLGAYRGETFFYDDGAVTTGIFWRLTSNGPDGDDDFKRGGRSCDPSAIRARTAELMNGLYDPTNGTISDGDILRSAAGQAN
jgi:prepilin-type N-terminal cleavage/methylation domain-containing protein